MWAPDWTGSSLRIQDTCPEPPEDLLCRWCGCRSSSALEHLHWLSPVWRTDESSLQKYHPYLRGGRTVIRREEREEKMKQWRKKMDKQTGESKLLYKYKFHRQKKSIIVVMYEEQETQKSLSHQAGFLKPLQNLRVNLSPSCEIPNCLDSWWNCWIM